jgi:hypothetical protein
MQNDHARHADEQRCVTLVQQTRSVASELALELRGKFRNCPWVSDTGRDPLQIRETRNMKLLTSRRVLSHSFCGILAVTT